MNKRMLVIQVEGVELDDEQIDELEDEIEARHIGSVEASLNLGGLETQLWVELAAGRGELDLERVLRAQGLKDWARIVEPEDTSDDADEEGGGDEEPEEGAL